MEEQNSKKRLRESEDVGSGTEAEQEAGEKAKKRWRPDDGMYVNLGAEVWTHVRPSM